MSKKNSLDKYYTNPKIAAHCVNVFKELIPKHQRKQIIEPSAGNGAFLSFFDDITAYDLVPEHANIIQKDFFDVTQIHPTKTTTILGNPPFGKNSSLAIKFFNHATTLANTIAFIVPQTFRKLSVHKRLNLNFHLTHDEILPKNSFLLNDNPYDVPCVFQIWRYQNTKRTFVNVENPYFKFIKKSEAELWSFCVSRVGSKAGEVLGGLNHNPKTTYFCQPKVIFGKQIVMMAWYYNTIKIAKNTAAQKSISKTELAQVVQESMDVFLNSKRKEREGKD